MPNRSIFNRNYTSYQADGTTVYLANGQGVVTNPAPTATLTAGADLIAGEVVSASGSFVVPSTALSGVNSYQFSPIGFASEAASNGSDVIVNLDGVISLTDVNITADTALIPGEYYYLSKFEGEVVRFTTTSGTVTGSGSNAYQAATSLGLAITATQLSVEISPPVLLYTGG